MLNFTKLSGLALASTVLASAAHAGSAITAGDSRFPPGFTIDFSSIGTGINTQANTFVQERLANALREGSLREFTLTPWGREGERKVCFVLTGNAAWELVLDLRAAGLEDDRVHISPATSCGE